MLAAVEAQMVLQGRLVLVTADLKSAFDNIAVKDVKEAHKKLFEARPVPEDEKGRAEATERHEKLLGFVESVVRGHDTQRARGVDQGNPYSPTCLGGVLHYGLDLPVSDMIESPLDWFRYADNFAYTARSVSEGRVFLRKLRKLLKPLGLALNLEGGVVNLAKGHEAELLGFSLRWRDDKVEYGLGKKALAHLAQNLEELHDRPNPTEAARQSLLGWIESVGPAFQNGVTEIPRILRLAAEHGFRELASPVELRRHWENAWGRWLELREREYSRRQG